MDIELIKSAIRLSNATINAEKLFIANAEQSLAEHLCAFQVGDEVIDINGSRGKVDSISPGYHFDFAEVKVRRYKKDGSLRVHPSHTYSSEGWKPYGGESK